MGWIEPQALGTKLHDIAVQPDRKQGVRDI